VRYDDIDLLRDKHAAWHLLRAGNAVLVLSFLGDFFVDANRGPTPASQVADSLDDLLYSLNAEGDEPRYPKPPQAYLEDWSAPEAGYLRRFYPAGNDEVHYEVTPAFVTAYTWVESLKARSFVGTESRLHIVVELLRQIVHGANADPNARRADLLRRRAEIDNEIAAIDAGHVPMLDDTGIRDRYQQFGTTARELLADFREVDENFRQLNRSTRESIAAWRGSKGELLENLVTSRSSIDGSDQGRSFQAFYDFLLSESRQAELSDLLAQVAQVPAINPDERLRRINNDWAEAAERTQRTVRQISEQLRRFLDDQVWLENRRVVDLVRAIEAAALSVRDNPPAAGLEIDGLGITISLPLERPIYERVTVPDITPLSPPQEEAKLDTDQLFSQTFIDSELLATRVRNVLRPRSTALLSDIVSMYPIEQGVAEIVGYLSLDHDDLSIDFDTTEEMSIDYASPSDANAAKRATMPQVKVSRS